MADISPVSATNNNLQSSDATSRITPKTLGQDDFLKLLITQFTNQDPLSPMKDTEYVAQMAQFTSLEQAKTMTSTMSQLRSDQHVMQANGMIGRTVELQPDSSTGISTTGVVTGVSMEKGEPLIVINQVPHSLSEVLSIRP